MMAFGLKRHLHLVRLMVVAAGLVVAGHASAVTLTGQWSNTTFGSFGDLTVELTVTPPNYSVSLDADGFVFGASNPDPIVFAGVLEGDGSVNINITDDPTFGDITGTISNLGVMDVQATDIPNPGIFSMTMAGNLSATAMAGTYRIEFNDPQTRGGPGTEGADFALGTFNAVPEPTSLALLTLGTLLFARRR